MMAMVFRSFALCLMIALLAAGTHTAAAQRVVGGSRPPEVEVDLGVLDSLGPAPTLPDLLHGQARSGRNAAAASTGSGTAQRAALQAPRHKKKPKSTAHARAQESKTVASAEARAAAPVKPVAANSGTVTRHGVATTPLPDAAALAKPSPMPALPTPAPPPPAPALAPAPTAVAPAGAPALAKESAEPATPPAAAAPAAPAPPAPAPPAPPAPAAPAPPAPTASAPPAPGAPSATGEKLVAAIPPPVAAPPPAAANAAVPAAVTLAGERTVRMQFAAGAEEVPETAKTSLDDLVQKLAANEQARLQLIAYAAGGANEANEARRLSLRRAVAVRNYLRDKGIASSRMDVRALGNRSEGSAPADRVDIVMLDR
jgi:outer membrane protein OmpA-like peptidoglycan-associated protein